MRELIDLIPAGKYLSGLVKTGKTAGIVGVKTSIKTSWKEDLEPQLASGIMPSGGVQEVEPTLVIFQRGLCLILI